MPYAFASETENNFNSVIDAHISLITFVQENNISLDISLEQFTRDYQKSGKTLDDFYQSYSRQIGLNSIPVIHQTSDNGKITDTTPPDRGSGTDKWYYNTGTTLPQIPTYGATYALLTRLTEGDIIYEDDTIVGIMGHIAIVEGKYYDSSKSTYYIRLIEAITPGVSRSVLDDERVDDKNSRLCGNLGATLPSMQRESAVNFARGQLGKPWILELVLPPQTSASALHWYCSELAWASYQYVGVNISSVLWPIGPLLPANIRDYLGWTLLKR